MCRLLSIFILTLFLSASQCQYLTTPTRTPTVGQLCSMFPDRTQIISEQDKTQIQQYNQAIKASFSMTGNDLIMSLIKTKDPNALLQQYPQIKQQYGIFVGPFLVGFVLLMFSCSCMCCCCCCPGCCPPKCCRQPQNTPYSRIQLIWPGVVLLICLGLILTAGAIGLSKNKDLQTTVNAVGCSVSIAIDDIINGNATKDYKFFVGVKTLANKIIDIRNNLATISSNVNSVSAAIGNANTAFTNAVNSIDLIPTGVAGGKVTAFSYNTPLNANPTSSSIPSQLPDDLGSTNPADNSSAVYLVTDALTKIQNGLNQVKTAADGVNTAFSDPNFSGILDTVKDSLNNIVSQIENGDAQFGIMFAQATAVMPTATTAMTGIYAGFIGLAVLAIIPTLFLLICSWYKCRLFLYFTCCLFLLVGLISFLLATFISALIPILYFTCDFTTYSFSSAANFNNNFNSVIPPDMQQYTSIITVCLPGSSGDFLTSSMLGSVTTQLSDFRTSMLGINQFDATQVSAGVGTAWDQLNNLVNGYFFGNLLDFNDVASINIINRLADKNNYPSCDAASSPIFQTDSWIPTTLTPRQISCTISSGNIADQVDCASATDITMNTGTGTCNGCMDIFQIHLATLARASSIVTQVSSRYAHANCSGFLTQFTNIMANYYQPKRIKYSMPLANSVISRTQTAAGNVAAYQTQINIVGTSFSTALTTLNTVMSTIIDPNYGLIAGLNCAILGQDILLVNNVACMHGFKLTFFIRAAFGMAAFGIYFAMCCMVCTGSRHFRQSDVLSKSKLIDDAQLNKRQQTLQQINPGEKNFSNANLQNSRVEPKMNNLVNDTGRQIQMQNYVDKQRFTSVQPPPIFQ